MPDQKISALSAAGALDGTEQFPLVQSAGTKRSLISAIRAWMLPSGGTTGQVLSKASATDYDFAWATSSGGGGGGPTAVGAHRFWGLRNMASGAGDLSMVTLAFRTVAAGADATTATAFASSSFDGSTLPANAFDGNAGTLWAGIGGDHNASLWGDFGTPVSFVELAITARSGGLASQTPRDFSVVFSDDGIKFYELVHVSFGSTNFTSSETKTVALPTTIMVGGASSGDPRITQRTGSLVRPGGTSDTGVGAGYVTPGIFNMEIGASSFGFPAPGTEPPNVAANECYARPLKILRSTQITQVRIYVGATAAGQTVSYRIYSNSVDGRPGVPVSEKMTLSVAAAGLVSLTLTTPVTLAPGLYWVLTTCTSSAPTCRCVSGCGAIPLYNGGFVWTGLYQGSAAARLDSADLSAQTWLVDTGATNISSTRDTAFFDFTIV